MLNLHTFTVELAQYIFKEVNKVLWFISYML